MLSETEQRMWEAGVAGSSSNYTMQTLQSRTHSLHYGHSTL